MRLSPSDNERRKSIALTRALGIMRGEEVAAGESWAISDNYQVTHCHTGPSWTSLTFSNNSKLREWSNVLEREGCISLHSVLASLDFNGRLMRESHLGGTILVTRENV